MGGLSKKAAFLNTIRKENANATLLIDAGNSLFKEQRLPATAGAAEAARIKAAGVVAAYRAMGLHRAGIGTHDLAAGPAFLKETAGDGFTWLSVNLVDRHSGRPLFPTSTTVQVGGLRVALIALTGPGSADHADYDIRPWQEVLPALVAELRAQAHMLVLLSNYPLSENRKIATACPGLDLIFQSGHVMGNVPPMRTGNALISQSESRGRYVGVLEVDWQGPGRWRQHDSGPLAGDKVVSSYRQRFVPLSAAMPDDPSLDVQLRQVEERARAAAAK